MDIYIACMNAMVMLKSFCCWNIEIVYVSTLLFFFSFSFPTFSMQIWCNVIWLFNITQHNKFQLNKCTIFSGFPKRHTQKKISRTVSSRVISMAQTAEKDATKVNGIFCMFWDGKQVFQINYLFFFVSASGCLKYKHLNTQLFEIYMNILHAFDTWMEFHTFRSLNTRQRRKQEQHTTYFCSREKTLVQFFWVFFYVLSEKEEKNMLGNYN